jgi:hypothetical protein
MDMKKKVMGTVLLIFLILFAGQGISYSLEDSQRPPSKKRVERIRKKVVTFKMWRLTERLDLDEKSASRLFPLIKRYDKKKMPVEQGMRRDMRRLRKIVDTAKDDELQDIIEKLKENHRKLEEINAEEMSRLGDILTVRDMARFMIFTHDFQRDMRKRIYEIKAKRRKNFMKRELRQGFSDTVPAE